MGADLGSRSNHGTGVIEVQLSRLRKKVDGNSDRQLITTVRGVGYMIGEAPSSVPVA